MVAPTINSMCHEMVTPSGHPMHLLPDPAVNRPVNDEGAARATCNVSITLKAHGVSTDADSLHRSADRPQDDPAPPGCMIHHHLETRRGGYAPARRGIAEWLDWASVLRFLSARMLSFKPMCNDSVTPRPGPIRPISWRGRVDSSRHRCHDE